MTIEHRVLITNAGRRAFYDDDTRRCCDARKGRAELCEHCAAAWDRAVELGLIVPDPPAAARAAAKKPRTKIVRRAATCGCKRGADGRTAAERASDRELVAELRELRGATTTTTDEETVAMSTDRGPYPWTRALAAKRGEDPDAAAEAEAKRDGAKLARQATMAKLVREEHRLARRRHAAPQPYTAALERRRREVA